MHDLTNQKPLTYWQKSLMASSASSAEQWARMDDLKRWGEREESRPLLKVEKSKVKFTKALRTAMSYDVIKGVQGLLP